MQRFLYLITLFALSFTNAYACSVSILSSSGSNLFCQGQPARLTAVASNAGSTYQWSLNSAVIPGATDSFINVTATGTYSVVAISGSCTTSNSLAVTMNIPPAATISPSGTITVCSNNTTVSLSAALAMGCPSSYQWKVNGINLPAGTGQNYTPTIAGNYTVSITNMCTGCMGTTSSPTTVVVSPIHPMTITPGGTVNACGSSFPVLLTASNVPGVTYSWSPPLPGIPGMTYSATQRGTYRLATTNPVTGCSRIDSVVIDSIPNPAAPVAAANSPVCAGDTLQLTALTPTSGTINYSWTGPGFTSALQNPKIANADATMAGTYSVTAYNGNCPSTPATVAIAVTCLDSLWPGDANYDLVADNNDVLHIALGYGGTGFTRTGASTAWTPQHSRNWGTTITTVNAKHADCDGNGLIDQNDTLAVSANYLLTHLRNVRGAVNKGTGLPTLQFDFTGVPLVPGTRVSIPIRLGNATSPMTHLAGIAAKITVTGFTPTNNPSIIFPTTWLGNSGNLMRFSKLINSNRVDWTSARIDHHTASGNGVLANLIVDIPASTTLQTMGLYFDDVRMIDSAGNALTDFNIAADSVIIAPTSVANQRSSIREMILKPNPSTSNCVLLLSMQSAIKAEVRVTDLLGRVVWVTTTNANNGVQQVTLPSQQLEAGIYFVSLYLPETGEMKSLRWVKER